MTVWLNGEKSDTRGAQTVAELAEHYQLPAYSILIEHNGVALHHTNVHRYGFNVASMIPFTSFGGASVRARQLVGSLADCLLAFWRKPRHA